MDVKIVQQLTGVDTNSTLSILAYVLVGSILTSGISGFWHARTLAFAWWRPVRDTTLPSDDSLKCTCTFSGSWKQGGVCLPELSVMCL